MADFSVDEVVEWARDGVGIRQEHADQLAAQEINGQALLKMTENKLRSYGIPGGPAIQIMDAIEEEEAGYR
jgi:hypothetical protein